MNVFLNMWIIFEIVPLAYYQNFEILTVATDGNSFTVDTGGSASSGSTAGGGGSVTAAMEIDVGLNTTVLGNGWGAG